MRDAQKQFWTMTGSLAGILMLLLTIWAMVRPGREVPNPEPVAIIFFSDSAGMPHTGIWLMLLNGERIEPDADGMARIPRSRAGEEASVRDQATRRELCALTLPQPSPETTRIIVPTRRTARCR